MHLMCKYFLVVLFGKALWHRLLATGGNLVTLELCPSLLGLQVISGC